MAERVCSVCGGGPVRARGMCWRCYQRWWRANKGVGVRDVDILVEEGKEEIAGRVNKLLREYGIKCWYEGGVVYVEVGGKVEEG